MISVVIAAAPAVIAGTVRGLSLADLVAESDLVARGRAVSEQAYQHPRLGIVRDVEIEVDRRLAGDCGERVHVLLLGGELETTATHVPGEAEIDVGDEAVLFLSSAGDGSGRFRVVGMSQGAFAVLRPPGADAAFAARELGSLNLVGEPVDDELGLARACTSTFVPLERFEELVVELARSEGI